MSQALRGDLVHLIFALIVLIIVQLVQIAWLERRNRKLERLLADRRATKGKELRHE